MLSPSGDSAFDLDSSLMKQFHEMANNRIHGRLLIIIVGVTSLGWCAQVDGERKKKFSFNFIASHSIANLKKLNYKTIDR